MSAAPVSRVLVAASPNSPNLGNANAATANVKPPPPSSPSSRLLAQVRGGNANSPSRFNAEAGNASGADDSRGSYRSWKRFEGLTGWERELVDSPEVRRKAQVAQLYFLNHYFDNLRYLNDRRSRTEAFKLRLAATETAASKSFSAAETLVQAREKDIGGSELSSYIGRERAHLRKRRTKLRLDSFHIITQVGQGGYGEVFLARKRETGEVCALKRLRKRVLVKMDEVRHVLTERDILTATRTPWLVRLLYAFQDSDHVFLAMEYVPGGDFRTLLNNSGVLREEHARFYAAEMFVAVNELHSLGYIHRDLKPENFLVDSTGHIKLTDFGLAAGALNPTRIESLKGRLDAVKDTELIYRTPHERSSLYKKMRAQNVAYADSIVGSPDYMAPEVLRGRSYNIGVDYWSLGCILFEFLCGFPPFSGGSPDETWTNLKNWEKVLQRPVYDKPQDLQFNLSDVAWDAVTRLIDQPQRRYNSLVQIQTHAFFAPLNLPSYGRCAPLRAPAGVRRRHRLL
ncbi:hypothetical protein IEQ34_025210 [Dendrobium chrysotoxum]|uniref:non-specific serine/threonine protein kinase n=1 Tax=Dendrobium chrysotoxum TaxID=161865 RepID=A0AAV7FQI3_DENCH|nr:hypothetical protein IEQ34_025210 [Dendrobium chrysotoxum]